MRTLSRILSLSVLFSCASSKTPEPVDPESGASSSTAHEPASEASAHNDESFAEDLESAHEALAKGQTQAAITALDRIILHYEVEHVEEGTRNYSARTQTETLYYMLRAATEAAEGSAEGGDAVVLSILWSDAYYLRGYASIEQKQLDQGVAWLERAVALAPMNSQYLSELGHIYQTRKEWQRAMETYERARKATEFSPEGYEVKERTRAMRGIGFVLIETGDLDGAKAIYEECLQLDPDDATAKNELGYINDLMAKSPAP